MSEVIQRLKTVRRGVMFVIEAPSGTGKTTLIKKLLAQDENLKFSVSVTTRQKREGEVDGVDYEWDQQSVTYNSSGLEYYGMDLSSSQSSMAYSNSSMPIAVIIDGEKTSYPVYKDSVSENVYIEITSAGTGIYLILSPKK